jgi:hypothetical protein
MRNGCGFWKEICLGGRDDSLRGDYFAPIHFLTEFAEKSLHYAEEVNRPHSQNNSAGSPVNTLTQTLPSLGS